MRHRIIYTSRVFDVALANAFVSVVDCGFLLRVQSLDYLIFIQDEMSDRYLKHM